MKKRMMKTSVKPLHGGKMNFMKKYLVLYIGSEAASKQREKSSPEEMKKGMESWMAWFKKCGSGLVDMGSPLGGGLKVTPAGTSRTSQDVAGYTMLQAKNMDDALKMLKGHPHLSWAADCKIEIYEALPLPGSN